MTTSAVQSEYPETDELIRRLEAAANRDEAARHYRAAMALVRDDIDWARANRAIIDRWSVAALRYIKEQAWR